MLLQTKMKTLNCQALIGIYFSEQNGTTTVSITIVNESLDRLEKLIDGFKIGFTSTFENLTICCDFTAPVETIRHSYEKDNCSNQYDT
jgi:hypothetical protein